MHDLLNFNQRKCSLAKNNLDGAELQLIIPGVFIWASLCSIIWNLLEKLQLFKNSNFFKLNRVML